MATEELFTLAEISRIINIPESTCRYYRNSFPSYFTPIGKGKRKRYGREAITTLRFIAEHLRNGSTLAEVTDLLKQQFQEVIEVTATKATITQVDNHSLTDISASKALIQQLTTALMVISDYKQEMEEVKKQLRQLQQESTATMERTIERQARELKEAEALLKSKNDAMVQAGQEINRLKNELDRLKKPWWMRIFKK